MQVYYMLRVPYRKYKMSISSPNLLQGEVNTLPSPPLPLNLIILDYCGYREHDTFWLFK